MSNATLQVICKVDEDCIKPKVPSDKIYFKLKSQQCTQSVVTPEYAAAPGTDQVLSAVTYAGGGNPFSKCCWSDSDIKWDLYYRAEDGTDVKICYIHFHEPWSTSWHNSGTNYYDDDCEYDVMIKTIDDVKRSLKCELHVRPKVSP